jgi:hypothetical protein
MPNLSLFSHCSTKNSWLTAGYPLVRPLVLVFLFSRIPVLVLKTKNLILGSGSSSKNEPGSSFD